MIAPLALLSTMATSDFTARDKDWRCGPVVYQVFVDRFARPKTLNAALFAAPKVLHKDWDRPVVSGTKGAKDPVWSHELDFYGGDLAGIQGKLSYIKGVGADVLYTTPVFSSLTNHRYDAQDYRQISPELGGKPAFESLLKATQKQGMKFMLDGVFNHMGASSPFFKEALASPSSPNRGWYEFGTQYPLGYKGWAGVPNLPALKLENKVVRDQLWLRPDSVVQQWLKAGIDGWRLDVAFELGPQYLRELTQSAHRAKAGSWVVGEINGYPADWFGSLDGVFNFFAPGVVHRATRGEMSGGQASQVLGDWVADAGIENALRSWLHLDNHDTSRIASIEPDFERRKVLWAALFTLPGSPVIYYGSELGMKGEGDPGSRGTMRWELNTAQNPELKWVKQLTKLRASSRALKVGDFAPLRTDRLIGWVRSTDRFLDNRLVLINPTDKPVTETVVVRIGRLLSWGELEDQLGSKEIIKVINGLTSVTLPPHSMRIYHPLAGDGKNWTPYHRIP